MSKPPAQGAKARAHRWTTGRAGLLGGALGAFFSVAALAPFAHGQPATLGGALSDRGGAGLVLPEAPPDLTPMLGLPIVGVDVQVDQSAWREEVPEVRSVKPLEPFAPEVARRVLQEVLSTGRFAQGRAMVVREGQAVRLRVEATPRKVLQTLRISMGGTPLESDEILREGGLSEGAEVTAESLATAQDRMDTYLQRRGFAKGAVGLTLQATDDPRFSVLRVEVQPGPPLRVDQRYFYVFGAERRAVEAALQTYAVGEGERADELALDRADQGLEARLRLLGYFQAHVFHDGLARGDKWALRVRVDTGPKFSVLFEGNDHFDDDALEGALELDEDGDRSEGRFVQLLKDFYERRGFLDVEVTVENRSDDPTRARTLVFHLREGEPVHVVNREFPCLKTSALRELPGTVPRTVEAIGREIDSFLQEELPGSDLFRNPDPPGLDRVVRGPGSPPSAERPVPLELDPTRVYLPETYARAVNHIRDIFRNEGFLHAEVGPVQVLRHRCDPKSKPGECRPLAFPPSRAPACTYERSGLPLPVAPLDPALSCTPDPKRGIRCASTVSLRIPMKLGPRTMLHDLAFHGISAFTEAQLAKAAELSVGGVLSTSAIDEASRRIVEAYREKGYAFAEVRYTIESSPDHTRARVRFDVTEGEQVIVQDIVIHGLRLTQESLVRARIALHPGEPYTTSRIRRTQERLAALGVFESVDVGLENPFVPARRKVVVLRVAEKVPQYLEPMVGVSSGEGIRGAIEYGHLNIGGLAIGLGMRLQLSYLPDVLIFDDTVRQNFQTLPLSKRLVVGLTTSLTFPDIGLGPRVRASLDLVGAQDLQRAYRLRKAALIPGLSYRPQKELELTLSQSAEFNDLTYLGYGSDLALFLASLNTDPSVRRLLLAPEGASAVSAQKLTLAWDRRDNAFSPHRGTYLVTGVEHVDCYGLEEGGAQNADGHFLRLTETFSFYVPLPLRWVLAASLRVGQNVHLLSRSRSQTYPNRQFFLGGADSVRGFRLDHIVPQDKSAALPDTLDPGIQGGDIMVNPRLEVRIPVYQSFDTVAFFDAGNLWYDPFAIKRATDLLHLRTSAGTGLRWNTPVGVPFVLDVGFNLLPRPYERGTATIPYEVQFALGLF